MSGYNWDRGMSNNAVEAYYYGAKPISKWTKQELLTAVVSACFEEGRENTPDEVKNLETKLESWNLSQLRSLLTFDSWHHTSGAFNKTVFYRIDLEKVYYYIDHETQPEKKKVVKDEFEAGYVHGTYTEKTFHPYASHHKMEVHEIPFKNGRIKGNWLIMENGKHKELQNVTITNRTKIRKH